MKKKRDNLHQVLKNAEKNHLFDFLQVKDIALLSLTAKRYYVLLMPVVNAIRLDQVTSKNTEKGSNKPKKIKVKEEVSNLGPSIEVQVEKVPLHKFTKYCKGSQAWQKIDTLDFNNDYLNKKLQNRTAVFYKNKENGDLIFVSRSMVDPTLNYNRGGFGDAFTTQQLYEHFYEESQVVQQDFSSRQALLKRQKDLLERTTLKKEQQQKKQSIDMNDELKRALNIRRVGIILCFGGSFSFGIFEGGRCVLHKSDKKYVCRKKAGERQLNKDKNAGSSIQSMGSQIRRDQEKKHVINVGQILKQHNKDLSQCEIIFLQAPGLNRLFVINENENLDGLQDRLRSVCVTAKKANFTEVESLFEAISQVNIVKLAGKQEKQPKQLSKKRQQ